MTREMISGAVGNISSRHIEEAADYGRKKRIFSFKRKMVAAACLVLLVVFGGILNRYNKGTVVAVYAHGTNEEITASDAVMSSGRINDKGEMQGHPLMFYLSGEDIATVRFSCQNQQISFMDWTEKRKNYGNSKSFTVDYGADESEYYYLTIDWVPNALIRELTDNPDSRISTLPEELRTDRIVLEITFENGKTATKAINISLTEDGRFIASFGDYSLGEND